MAGYCGDPVGPGIYTHPTLNFNWDHNALIYQKLDAATRRVSVGIQVQKGTKNDGWAAWRNLLHQHGGFIHRDIDTALKQLETLKHQHGTNIALHLDKFDYLVGRLSRFGVTIPDK